ncbi:DUF2026 family protein [Aidingimonas lacisalsi]|uniref:DUF2026 family protein n=1 Tax=Aidingimonas lacisalsi TaxID=2604086 RepID=UPI0011D250AE|nr:DUF2026 family protein [Aidingimonas lacisalsi]
MPKGPLIPLRDFERIHKTIYSVISNEQGDPLKSCFFFSMFAAAIMRRHYKIDAKVTAGIAAYRLGMDDKHTLMFAEEVDGYLECTDNGFHAWVEADDWVIDFMAPLFPKITPCAAKMFQKKRNQTASTPDGLSVPGDFFVLGNQTMTDSLFDHFDSKPAYADLLEIAKRWYKRPPKKMAGEVGIENGKGKIDMVKLQGARLVGAW